VPFSSPEEAQRVAARLGARAQLNAVVLRELHWDYPERPVPPGLPISIDSTLGLQAGPGPDFLSYRVSGEFKGVVPDHPDYFTATVVFQLVYGIPSDESYSTEEIEAFGSVTVMMMAFPYLREALQDLGGRAGLPSLLLQPLRIRIDDSAPQHSEPSKI
jgi:hypothetical protein